MWDDDNSKWWFSVLDIVAIFNAQDDYAYDLFESGLLRKLELGSVKCLQQIHAFPCHTAYDRKNAGNHI